MRGDRKQKAGTQSNLMNEEIPQSVVRPIGCLLSWDAI
jgi:hypothetical protein